jgi:hypothetical protein
MVVHHCSYATDGRYSNSIGTVLCQAFKFLCLSVGRHASQTCVPRAGAIMPVAWRPPAFNVPSMESRRILMLCPKNSALIAASWINHQTSGGGNQRG